MTGSATDRDQAVSYHEAAVARSAESDPGLAARLSKPGERTSRLWKVSDCAGGPLALSWQVLAGILNARARSGGTRADRPPGSGPSTLEAHLTWRKAEIKSRVLACVHCMAICGAGPARRRLQIRAMWPG